MKCIRDMHQLTELDLSHNKFTKLAKDAFSKLRNLTVVDLSHNFIKKLSPQIFSKLNVLKELKVDKLVGYKTLKSLIPSLTSISITKKKMTREILQNITAIVNSQEIFVLFNDGD